MGLFCNRVTYEFLAVFNFGGSVQKTQKGKALEKCSMSPTVQCPCKYVRLAVLGFIWRLATPAAADREILCKYGSDYTWGDFGIKSSFHNCIRTFISN